MGFLSRFIAFVLGIILIPFFILIMTITFCFQGSPIFFTQKRVGKNFKVFKIIKFRTMKPKAGKNVTIFGDKRITYWGKILRKYKIDELPQIYNILLGDMRFIGPRPEVSEYFDKNSFKFLDDVKPGLSDFSSIILRNEEKILKNLGGNNPYQKLLPLKLKLAKYYSCNKSFFLDLFLVMVTIISIFLPNLASEIIIKKFKFDEIPGLLEFLDNYCSD